MVHDPVQTIKTNVDGSARILDFAAKYHKRIIIASTSEVYGKSAKDNFEENDDLIIGAPTHSRWSYACSKLIDEFLLMAYHQHSQLPGTIVRFFNIVGPRQTGKYGMVIPRFVQAAVNGKPIRVFGSGKQTRCFCHVADTVRALAALPDKREAYGQIYNIGSQNSISMMQLAEKVIEVLHSNSSIELIPYEQAYAKGFEDMMRRSPDTAKIKKLLAGQPERSLEDIINDVANEMRHSCSRYLWNSVTPLRKWETRQRTIVERTVACDFTPDKRGGGVTLTFTVKLYLRYKKPGILPVKLIHFPGVPTVIH